MSEEFVQNRIATILRHLAIPAAAAAALYGIYKAGETLFGSKVQRVPLSFRRSFAPEDVARLVSAVFPFDPLEKLPDIDAPDEGAHSLS